MQTILHISNAHCSFDDRIFYKELVSLSKKYDCYEIVASRKKNTLFNMGGQELPEGDYKGVHCLCYNTKHNFFMRCVLFGFRIVFPRIYELICDKIAFVKIDKILCNKGITPCLIHYHDLSFSKTARWLAKKYKAKLIFDCHEFYFTYPFNNGLNRKSLKLASKMLIKMKDAVTHCDGVISVTKTMDNIVSIMQGKNDSHCIVYNSSLGGGDNQVKFETGRKTVLVHEGSMSFNRGLKLMLEIFLNPFVKENFKLKIVGSFGTAEKEYMDSFMKEHQLTEENIFTTGWIDYENLYDYLTGDISLIFFEKKLNAYFSMPNKLFNYTTAGLPILSVDCADLSDTIELRKTGVIVQRNTASIVDGLKELKNNYAFYKKNVVNSFEDFSWKKDEQTLFEFYESIL